jgi:uncharacterized protein HemX
VVEELTEKQQTMNVPLEQPAPSRSGVWIGIIALLVVVLVAGAGFYLLQQLRSQGDNIDKEDQRTIEHAKQISGFQSQLAAMQSQLSNATATISTTDERFAGQLAAASKSQEEKLDTTRKELSAAIAQVQRQLGKTRGDWLIADAEYLLSVAGQRLHLIGDIETTREALEAADQRLRESGDAGAFKVREQIAKELASLRSIPVIDFVGMYSTLQSLSSRVEQLTLFLPYEGKPVAKRSEHDKHSVPSQTSSDLLNMALKQIDGYVTIRHTEQPIKAILTAEQAQFIRQQLSLKLEMVKVALVQKNQTLYQASLKDTLTWLEKHFNQNTQTQDFIAQLRKLDEVKLNAQMPDISLSLKMLRDITKLRIEADKALPVSNEVENKVEKPAAESKPIDTKPVETKPVAAEKVTVTPSNNAAVKGEAEIKTDKLKADAAVIPVINMDEKKPIESITSEDSKGSHKTNSVTTEGKKSDLVTTDSDNKTSTESKKASEQKTTDTAGDSKKSSKPSTDAEKSSAKHEVKNSDKAKPAAVTKPIIVH